MEALVVTRPQGLEFARGMVPSPSWKWRERTGNFIAPAAMETRHLFFTLRMIWNNRMPEHMRVGAVRLYEFSAFYTREYLAEAILAIGQELLARTDMTPDWNRQLLRMQKFAQRADAGLVPTPADNRTKER